MYLMSILVVLIILSLIVNSSVLEAVVWLARALENNIYCSGLQKCTVEKAYMLLVSIILVLIIIIRVEKP